MKWMILFGFILLVACTQGTQSTDEVGLTQESSMPCHKMPDGSMMGDCDGDMVMDHSMHNVDSVEEFVVEMIPHHQEAVDTSLIIVQNTQNQELRTLAQDIIDAQRQEITYENQWVQDDYEGGYEATYQNMMPELESLSGVDQDNAYLEGMIMHHEMAVVMAEQVFMLSPPQKVADFANDVIEVQTSEIELMRNLLR